VRARLEFSELATFNLCHLFFSLFSITAELHPSEFLLLGLKMLGKVRRRALCSALLLTDSSPYAARVAVVSSHGAISSMTYS
jgi:hypothetical protein